ncbi:MAG: hypothetical protein DMF04_07365 [Verrucomicrobia bacterium]|nr:MAG: hypothetical protein DMF04_07365 [Verrucomicrobiota bacterium]
MKCHRKLPNASESRYNIPTSLAARSGLILGSGAGRISPVYYQKADCRLCIIQRPRSKIGDVREDARRSTSRRDK